MKFEKVQHAGHPTGRFNEGDLQPMVTMSSTPQRGE